MGGSADLMPRIDEARNRHQAAKDRLSEARGMLGQREAPPEPQEENRGWFDRVRDSVSNVSLSDVGHTILDGAGMIPFVGAVADVAHAGWYAAEGDWTNAGLSALGAVPFAGDAATAARLANRATDAVRAVDNATDATRVADAGGGGGRVIEGGGGGGRSEPWWEASNVGPNRQGSQIPESFDLRVGETNYHVHPNATKHMEEYARWSRQETGVADNLQNRTQRHGTGGTGEVPVSSLAGAVEQAQVQGLRPGRNFGITGDWELGIDTSDNVIFHAVYRPPH